MPHCLVGNETIMSYLELPSLTNLEFFDSAYDHVTDFTISGKTMK